MTATAQKLPVSFDEIERLIKKDLPPWEEKKTPATHPRLAVFLAAHGAYPEEQQHLRVLLKQLQQGKHAAVERARGMNADLRLYELNLAAPSADFRLEDALAEEPAAHAISYGMMSVEPGVDLLYLQALNPVAQIAAEHILAAKNEDVWQSLPKYGGTDICAMMGALIAARLAQIPVIVEDRAGEAAKELLFRLRKDSVDHVRKN